MWSGLIRKANMTYEQSIRNIETLKNFIHPWNSLRIDFYFTTDSDFNCIIHKLDEENEIKYAFNKSKPYAVILKNIFNCEILHYIDSNVTLDFDLTNNQVVEFISEENLRPKNALEIKNQVQALIRELKHRR